jgi:hypothetical protein
MSANPPVTLASLSAEMDGALVAIADVVGALRTVGARLAMPSSSSAKAARSTLWSQGESIVVQRT